MQTIGCCSLLKSSVPGLRKAPWKLLLQPGRGCLLKAHTCSLSRRRGVHAQAQLTAPKPAAGTVQGQDGCIHIIERDEDKERSRASRRTHFSHEDWARHRCTSRYWRHLKSSSTSNYVRSLAGPMLYVGIISMLVCSYEHALKQGLLDLWGLHFPSLSLSIVGPFSLSTFALSLLLVFRTNGSYQRWNEARKFWGLCTNRSRDIARQSLQWMPAETDATLLAAMLRWTAAFPLALMCSLREDHTLEEVLKDVLLPGELQLLLAQPHPGTACLQAMGACVKASHATAIQKMRIDENITVMQDVMGGCERIFKTPIPLSYTRHTSRFLVCWLTMLPFCVADAFGWATIPISIGMAFFLFGIEEIGVQIEEPFGILPFELYCNNIKQNIKQAEVLYSPLITAAEAELIASPATAAVVQAAPTNDGNYNTVPASSNAVVHTANNGGSFVDGNGGSGSRSRAAAVKLAGALASNKMPVLPKGVHEATDSVVTSEDDIYVGSMVAAAEMEDENMSL